MDALPMDLIPLEDLESAIHKRSQGMQNRKTVRNVGESHVIVRNGKTCPAYAALNGLVEKGTLSRVLNWAKKPNNAGTLDAWFYYTEDSMIAMVVGDYRHVDGVRGDPNIRAVGDITLHYDEQYFDENFPDRHYQSRIPFLKRKW